MRKIVLSAIGLGAAAALAVSGFAGSANAFSDSVEGSHHGVVSSHVNPAKKGRCYSNLARGGEGKFDLSQTFTDAGLSEDDSYGANDFTVRKPCVVTGVFVYGAYFMGSGPADSETVTFYDNTGTTPGGAPAPGKVLDTQTVVGTDFGGAFDIPITPYKVQPGPKGNTWVSVSVTMAFATGGEWGWEIRDNFHSDQGEWENPGGGIGQGCTTWDTISNCFASSGQPASDYVVTLLKHGR